MDSSTAVPPWSIGLDPPLHIPVYGTLITSSEYKNMWDELRDEIDTHIRVVRLEVCGGLDEVFCL